MDCMAASEPFWPIRRRQIEQESGSHDDDDAYDDRHDDRKEARAQTVDGYDRCRQSGRYHKSKRLYGQREGGGPCEYRKQRLGQGRNPEPKRETVLRSGTLRSENR
jgi:hypothetical protein